MHCHGDKMKYCTKCGTPNEDTALFCKNCGTSLSSNTSQPISTQTQSASYKISYTIDAMPQDKNRKINRKHKAIKIGNTVGAILIIILSLTMYVLFVITSSIRYLIVGIIDLIWAIWLFSDLESESQLDSIGSFLIIVINVINLLW